MPARKHLRAAPSRFLLHLCHKWDCVPAVKVFIYCDERYPDYTFRSQEIWDTQKPKEVSDDKYAEWQRISAAYDQMQEELSNLYDLKPIGGLGEQMLPMTARTPNACSLNINTDKEPKP
jgi:hypothetical protein